MADVDLTAVAVPGNESAWSEIGFDASGIGFGAGKVWMHTGAESPGWAFSRGGGESLPVPAATQKAPSVVAEHPNTTTKIDHVVLTVDSLSNAIAAFGSAFGIEPRRVATPREGFPEMAFFRCGEAIVEVFKGDTTQLWGVVFRVASIDVAAQACGTRLKPAKDAIQGGRIATVDGGVEGFEVAFLEKR